MTMFWVRREDFEDGGIDETRYSLEALQAFPERFPALWAALSADHLTTATPGTPGPEDL